VEGRFIVDKIAMKKSRLMRMGRKEGGWLLGGKRRRWNMVVMDEVQMREVHLEGAGSVEVPGFTAVWKT
jgi:hypothetical protein